MSYCRNGIAILELYPYMYSETDTEYKYSAHNMTLNNVTVSVYVVVFCDNL